MNDDTPFPGLDPTESIPLELGKRLRAAYEMDWHRLDDQNHWLTSTRANLDPKLNLESVATFVWAIACFRDWLSSPDRKAAYDLASKRVHYIPQSVAGIRPIVAWTVHLYSLRGGQRLEAQAALGFALFSGKEKHSRRLWRSFAPAIYREGLGKPASALSDEKDAVGTYFKKLNSRLNTSRDEIGDTETLTRSRKVFAALRSAAFEIET